MTQLTVKNLDHLGIIAAIIDELDIVDYSNSLTYEARVVIGTYAKMDSKPGQFEGVRWARHGNGFGKY